MGALNELKQEIMPIYMALKDAAKYVDCPRCIGKGDIRAFRHVKGGVCFKCGGSKRAPANAAARNASELNRLYASVKQSWHLGIREIEALPATKSIRQIINRLPKKYNERKAAH